jgi:hypothetical protein
VVEPVSLATRLDKLLPSLSVRQRIALILRAEAAGEEPDRELSKLHTLAERQEYDRFVALIIAANHELGAMVFGLSVIAADLESRLEDAELLRSAADLVAEEQGEGPPKGPVRTWRRLKSITVPEFLCGVAEDIRVRLQRQIDLRWQEMQALEQVWAEVAEQFGGEDPRHPDLKAQAGEVSCLLRELATKVSLRPRRLPEPSEEMLAGMRARVAVSFGYLGLRETRE